MTVNGIIDASEMMGILPRLAGDDARKIEVNMSSASMTDFMLLQFIALLRREGKDVSLNLTDSFQPSFPLASLLGV